MATTKTVTGTYKTGYTLASGYRILSITSTGSIEGSGLTIPSQSPDLVAVYNLGSIYNAYRLGGPAAVTLDGVTRFVNGDAAHTSVTVTADVFAVYAQTGSQYSRVINYGTLLGDTSGSGVAAVLLNVAQGSVRNGADSDTTALIEGGPSGGGIYISTDGLVANYGTIMSNSDEDPGAVVFANGGTFTNGSAQDPGALASGHIGFDVLAGAGQLTNYGVVQAHDGVVQGAYQQTAVILDGGGSIDNTGRISGPNGVVISGAAGTVLNDGRVIGYNLSGLSVYAGGTIVNGSASDQSALIGGHEVGVALTAGGGLTNFGVIASDISGYGFGVSISAKGTVVNGSAADTGAVIEGYRGLDLGVGSSGSNYGLIEGLGAYGAAVADYSRLTNGASDDRTALIEGPLGVTLVSHSEVTNFGTVDGLGGTAVSLDSTSTLVAEAGAVFEGAVLGGGGSLELAAGSGTITLLAGDSLAVSGPAPTTTFSNFGTVQLDAGPGFTVVSGGTIAAGQEIIDDGVLTAGGSLTLAGSLLGTGTLALAGGDLTLASSASLTVAEVVESGAARAMVAATGLTYAGVWTQTAGSVRVAAGDKISFTGTGDAFAGTLAGKGTVAFAGGSDSLNGATLSAATQFIADAAVSFAGTVTLAQTLTATSSDLTVAAGGATLSGGGALVLTDAAKNSLSGATATATLTNDDRIRGAGNLGGGVMTLVNAAGGIIEGDDAAALTIDTGAAIIGNAGVIENTGAGGTLIKSAIDNTGTLLVTKGVLTLDGAVTGAGKVQISGGTADFASSFSQNVTFRPGSTGTLELARSQGFKGTITGFSTSGATTLDLGDIGFVSAGEATFVENKAGTSGVLTVTDGTHTATITLEGNYSTSTFVASSDGHGGTRVVDPSVPALGTGVMPATGPQTHPFVAAMAGMGKIPGAASPGVDFWRAPAPELAMSRAQFA